MTTGACSSGRSAASSTTLVNRLKAREPEAWQQLIDLYSPLVYSWCRRSGMHAEDAADVLQEVLQAVLSGIAGFRHDRPNDTFRGWLRVVVQNKIRDHFRHRRAQPEAIGGSDPALRFMQIATDESITSTSLGTLGMLYRRSLELIRAEFGESTWQAFWLSAMERKSSSDVAQQLGMSAGAVRQAKYKVLRRLRRELGDVPR